MASADYTTGGTVHTPYGKGGVIVSYTHDFRKLPHSATDVLKVISVPAGAVVEHVVQQVHRAEGSAGNCDVGDGSDPDGFLVDASINSVAGVCSGLALTEGTPNTITGYSNGKFYAAADTIDAIPSIDLDYALVTWSAYIVPMFVDLASQN